MNPLEQLNQLDYYRLLEVTPTATYDQIRDAFHRFAQKYHPDQHVATPDERIALTTKIYARGAEAYRILHDPEKRNEYNEGLAQGQLRHRSVFAAPLVEEPAPEADSVTDELPEPTEPEPLSRSKSRPP